MLVAHLKFGWTPKPRPVAFPKSKASETSSEHLAGQGAPFGCDHLHLSPGHCWLPSYISCTDRGVRRWQAWFSRTEAFLPKILCPLAPMSWLLISNLCSCYITLAFLFEMNDSPQHPSRILAWVERYWNHHNHVAIYIYTYDKSIQIVVLTSLLYLRICPL